MSIIGQNIIPAVFYGLSIALVAAVVGAIIRTIRTGSSFENILSNIVSFNSPLYPPTNIRPLLFFIMYLILGFLVYLANVATGASDQSQGNLFIGLRFIDNYYLIPTYIQLALLLYWPWTAYMESNTPNQVELPWLDPMSAFNRFKDLVLNNAMRLIKPSNWKFESLAFIIPFFLMLFSLILGVSAIIYGVMGSVPIVLLGVLNIIFARLILQLLSDENLNKLEA